MPDEFLAKSVTANEITSVRNGAVINLIVPFYQGYDRLTLPPVAPPYWSIQRDAILRATIHHEAMWGASIGIAITRLSSMSFNIISKKPKLARDAQEILINADGIRVGWVGFMAKTVRDYLTTDNGAFFEIVRATKQPASKVIGIRHLDSLRVTRTGDPDIPALYRDRWGRIHEMKDYQIVMFSDMPDPSETYYGVGISAATRAYNTIYKLSAIEWYLREKVSGLHPLAIHIVNGVLDQQLKGAVEAAKAEQISRGLVAYMGAVIVGVPQEQQPMVATIPLAELPDRFNRKEEFDIAMLTYANSIGLDVQDLQPLSNGNLGTSQQSQILNDKAKGKGMIAFQRDFIHAMNHYVLPDGVEFEWTEKDYRDMTQKEGVSMQRVQRSAARITAGITTAAQELQILVDEDELPKEFLLTPHTPEENLSDEEDPSDQLDYADVEGQPAAPGVDADGNPLAPKPVAAPIPPAQPGALPGQPPVAAGPIPPDVSGMPPAVANQKLEDFKKIQAQFAQGGNPANPAQPAQTAQPGAAPNAPQVATTAQVAQPGQIPAKKPAPAQPAPVQQAQPGQPAAPQEPPQEEDEQPPAGGPVDQSQIEAVNKAIAAALKIAAQTLAKQAEQVSPTPAPPPAPPAKLPKVNDLEPLNDNKPTNTTVSPTSRGGSKVKLPAPSEQVRAEEEAQAKKLGGKPGAGKTDISPAEAAALARELEDQPAKGDQAAAVGSSDDEIIKDEAAAQGGAPKKEEGQPEKPEKPAPKKRETSRKKEDDGHEPPPSPEAVALVESNLQDAAALVRKLRAAMAIEKTLQS